MDMKSRLREDGCGLGEDGFGRIPFLVSWSPC
jgi:hypothetical protein